MNKKATIIGYLLSLSFVLFSIFISSSKVRFLYNRININAIKTELQDIIDAAEQIDTTHYRLSDYKFDYVVSESDSIIYWTTNKLDFRALEQISKTGVYHLSRRIYLVWIKQRGIQKIYYLVHLKNDFEFENEYLRNSSSNLVAFPPNYLPTNIESDYRVPLEINHRTFNLFFEKKGEDSLSSFWMIFVSLMYLLALLSFVFLYYQSISKMQWASYGKVGVWIFGLILILVLLHYTIPFAQDFYLFQPFDFANSFISSLGMLMINTIWIYIVTYYSLKIFSNKSLKFSFKESIIAQFLAFGIFMLLTYFIRDIIINSTSNFIDFDNVIMRYQDILSLLIFGVLILTYVKILMFILYHTKELTVQKILKHILVLYFPISLLLLLFDWHLIGLSIFSLTIALLISLKTTPYFSKATIRLILIFLGSVFVVSLVEYVSLDKERENKYLRLSNHQIENNRLAEYLLEDLDQKLLEDSLLLNLIYRLPETEQNIYDYIQMQYFTGFWFQYQGDITICGSDNIFKSPNDIKSCDTFFNKQLQNGSKALNNSHFVAIANYGIDNYLGTYHFIRSEDSLLVNLYILLKPKNQHKNLGYPSILLSKEVDKNDEPNYYSFAKYIDGKLVTHSGKYNYPLDYLFPQIKEQSACVEMNKYNHLIERQSKRVYNIISAKKQSVWDFFIILSYVFILYISLIYLVKLLNQIALFDLSFQNTLKGKLRLIFLGLIVGTFVIIAWAIIYKSTDLFAQKQKNVLDEKMQSVLVELKHKLAQSDNFNDLNVDYLNYLLTKFSNVFFTDINLYDLSGRLIASSRPEVFEKKLIGNRINPQAFYYLSQEKKSRYIHNEQIGTQKYLSAYVPFKNAKNKSIAYLNLPYFAKDKEIKSDVTILVTAFLNIFVFLFLITGLFTVFISNRITLPLVLIQRKLKDFKVGKKNEPITYKLNDEIGALVTEYNRTVEELNKNIELLAQKEREEAWKEMAKQIAHEIKNPLTPMKLSLQHLKYIWKDDIDNKDKKLNETVDLVVRQIDNLAEIASTFSDFSKMTEANQQSFDILNLIQDQIVLYSKEAQIEIKNQPQNKLYVFADERQISRVFQNLLTNAIQAIPEDRKAKIIITVEQQADIVNVRICDNGKGMDNEIQEKLFEPNFTTKNSGMGLGLAIVKQIMENNSGIISFETKPDIGTCFNLSFPKA